MSKDYQRALEKGVYQMQRASKVSYKGGWKKENGHWVFVEDLSQKGAMACYCASEMIHEEEVFRLYRADGSWIQDITKRELGQLSSTPASIEEKIAQAPQRQATAGRQVVLAYMGHDPIRFSLEPAERMRPRHRDPNDPPVQIGVLKSLPDGQVQFEGSGPSTEQLNGKYGSEEDFIAQLRTTPFSSKPRKRREARAPTARAPLSPPGEEFAPLVSKPRHVAFDLPPTEAHSQDHASSDDLHRRGRHVLSEAARLEAQFPPDEIPPPISPFPTTAPGTIRRASHDATVGLPNDGYQTVKEYFTRLPKEKGLEIRHEKQDSFEVHSQATGKAFAMKVSAGARHPGRQDVHFDHQSGDKQAFLETTADSIWATCKQGWARGDSLSPAFHVIRFTVPDADKATMLARLATHVREAGNDYKPSVQINGETLQWDETHGFQPPPTKRATPS